MVRVVQALALIAALGAADALGSGSWAQRASANQKSDKPVDAEAALDKALKALSRGRGTEAAELADQVIASKSETPRNTARALAVRGRARAQQNRLAEAISDLDQALWVKGGLAGSERAAAESARGDAYRAAGVSVPGTSAPAASPRREASAGSTPRPVRAATAEDQPAPTSSGGGGLGNFFAKLFGGTSSSGAASQPPSGNTAALPAAAVPVAAVSSSQALRSDTPPLPVRAPPRPPQAARAENPVRAASATLATGGSFQLQLTAVRSRAEANTLAAKVRKQHGAALAGQKLEVNEAVFGNMGRFYRARFGPFGNAVQPEAICASLRHDGVDCMVIGAQ